MILSQEAWMELRRFQALAAEGASWAEIARETGHDWRTVKRYLGAEAPSAPPSPRPRGRAARKIDPYGPVIDAWLAAEPRLRASVIYERLVAEHGFGGHYQRVKVYVREHRPSDVDRPSDLHRRFEVLPGAQAQVDWGDEGSIATPAGELRVWSFHLTLSHSRDPFTCFATGQDLATFWDCHRRAFAHLGGVPAAIVYDRTKTVVRRHVGRGQATPLHPEALAFAAHYGFAIVLAAPRRPTAKGRVERQVAIVRAHVLAGRSFGSVEEMDAAFLEWLPTRRAQVHRAHGEVIALRAKRDRAALLPLPDRPYLVCERHTRRVGKDCLVSFEASLYSLPWRSIRPGQRVELRVTRYEVAIWSLPWRSGSPEELARHARASVRGSWVVDPRHWDGLPDHGAEPPPRCNDDCELEPGEPTQLALPAPAGGWADTAAARVAVASRPLRSYDEAVLGALCRDGSAVSAPGSLVATRVREHAARLGLANLSSELDLLIERAEAGPSGYLEFLDLVLEEEIGVREGRRFHNALKLSGLPHHKTLDDFDFAFQPELDARKVRDLAALRFVEARGNVALLGPPGVGKTMLAVALAVAACQAGWSIYFTTLDDLVRHLREAEATGRFAKKLQTYLKPSVLVVDEVGYLPLARADANFVFQLVARRYERGSIVLTSNKAFAEWGQVFGDDVLASAILDRLLHHCDVVSINGPSYRLKDRMRPTGGGGSGAME